ncbi:GNAT family N-acetyltransferase [Citricoccus sp. SGAir0253]|uniref:GNAT family N-acetyltransferase n=1 Tax=Citricoccus sp. SGAir0253 TaxID=2567881 RepID=UPI0010CCF036|nr:GNAT family protein [Citricoccus sp. SGAir0253]QCU79149.1 GNAT family N-acetyltransferase [Citricoccus sp. SGAir0253]
MDPVPDGGGPGARGTRPRAGPGSGRVRGAAGGPDFSAKPVLEGELVRLVPATGRHAPALHALLADPEVGRLTGSVHHRGDAAGASGSGRDWSVERLVEVYDRWSVAEDRTVWAIEDRSSGRVVGESVLNDVDPDNLSCGFRIWISGARDRGLGTEAVRLTLRHAFEDQRLHRVELEVYAFNPRARHVYEKAGFVLEGTLREALLFDGEWIDCHVMGLLAHEWRRAP